MSCPFSAHFQLSARKSEEKRDSVGAELGLGISPHSDEDDGKERGKQSRQSSFQYTSSSPGIAKIGLEESSSSTTLNLKCLNIAIQLLTSPPVSASNALNYSRDHSQTT